jgi:arsenate reductase
MERMLVYHNPKCSKSRGALEILQQRGVEFDTVEYLEAPPSEAELERILELLPDSPAELVRKDKKFEALGLDAGSYETNEAVVAVLRAHPELMQRPIALLAGRAVIGRPSERVLELLD